MRVRSTTAAAAACACVAVLAAGCGLGAGKQGGNATLTVTGNFGAKVYGKVQSAPTSESETAMRQLQRFRRVDTSYSARFVKAIDGLAGGTEHGRPVAWLYYINGIEAPVGAADTVLHPGDAVWWDRHDWGAAANIPAVVGSFPHPFTGAVEGKRPAVRLVCAPGADAPCAMVERRLADEGVPTARGLSGTAGKGSGLRVIVGTWARVRPDPAARQIEAGVAASGVYLRPAANGSAVTALRPDGSADRTFATRTGFIAATALEEQLPTWIVSGTDDAGVAIAAQNLTVEALANRFAVVFSGTAEPFSAPATVGR